MRIDLDISLDPTLGCGQAHRWRKTDDVWEGVLGDEIVRMRQGDRCIEVEGTDRRDDVLRYLGADDDLDEIISEISEADPYVAGLASRCPGSAYSARNRGSVSPRTCWRRMPMWHA